MSGVDLRLQPGVPISGRVAVEGASVPSPQQLRAIVVEPAALPGSIGALITGRTAGNADNAGQFVAGPVAPGPYALRVGNVPAGWAVKSITADGKDAFDPPLTIAAGGIRELVVTLTDKVIDLDGTVRAANGEPSAGVPVVIVPVNRSLWSAGTASPRVRTATTDRYGRYAFHALPAGEYALAAVQTTRSDLLNPQVLDMLMPSATRLTLADGDSRSQDLRATVIR